MSPRCSQKDGTRANGSNTSSEKWKETRTGTVHHKCSWPLVDRVPLELKTLVVSPQTVRPAGGRLQDSWLCALHLLSQHGHMCDGKELRRTRQPVRVVQRVLTVEGSPEDSLLQGLQAAESFHLVSRSGDQLLFGLTSPRL